MTANSYYREKSLGLGVNIETLANFAKTRRHLDLLKNVLTYRTALTKALKDGKDGNYVSQLMEKHEEKIRKDFQNNTFEQFQELGEKLQKISDDYNQNHKPSLETMLTEQARVGGLTEDEAVAEARGYLMAQKLSDYRKDPYILDLLSSKLATFKSDRAEVEHTLLRDAMTRRGYRNPGHFTPEGFEIVQQLSLLQDQRNGNYVIEDVNQEGKPAHMSFPVQGLIDETVQGAREAVKEPEEYAMTE